MEDLTIPEVATRLSVTPLTVRRWLNAGSLSGQHCDDRASCRIRERDLARFRAARRRGASPGPDSTPLPGTVSTPVTRRGPAPPNGLRARPRGDACDERRTADDVPSAQTGGRRSGACGVRGGAGDSRGHPSRRSFPHRDPRPGAFAAGGVGLSDRGGIGHSARKGRDRGGSAPRAGGARSHEPGARARESVWKAVSWRGAAARMSASRRSAWPCVRQDRSVYAKRIERMEFCHESLN